MRNVPLNFFGELKTEYEKRNQDYIEELKSRNEVLEKDAEKVLENGLRKLSAKGWEGAGYEKAKALTEDTTAPAEGTAPTAFELEETPLQRPSHRLPSGQMHRLQPLCLRLPVRRPLSLPGERKTSGSHVSRRVLLLRSLRHGLPERRHRAGSPADEPREICTDKKTGRSIKKYRESDISDHFPGIFFLKEDRPAHQTEQENSVDGAEDFFAADPVPVAEGETTHSSEET